MKNITKFALSILSSLFLLYTMTILDFLSFGTKLVGSKCHDKDIGNFNMSVFTYGSIAAQILFGTFTSLKGGICGGVIVESQPFTEAILRYCETKTKTVSECLTNVYVCIVISTLLFAFISLFCSLFGLGKIFEYIPKTALFGVMTSIGVSLIMCGKDEIYRTEYYYHLHYCMIIAVVLSLVALFIDEYYPGYIFFVPCYSLLIIGGFYVVISAMGYTMDDLRRLELIPTTEDAQVSFTALTEHISFQHVNLSIIIGSLKNIIGLAFLNLIHITVNVPSFASIMNIKANINSEFRTQGLANLALAFIGYPAYFINSSSVFFNRSGGNTKLHSIIGGIALTPLIFIGPKVRGFLPCILLSFIPIYIGFCFVYSNLISHLTRLSILDLFVIINTAVAGYYTNPAIGLVIGITLNAMIISLYNLKKSKYTVLPSEYIEKNCEIISINFVCYSLTKDLLLKSLSVTSDEVVIDLNACPYLDYESNNILQEYVTNFNGNIRISGVPANMYVDDFKKYML